jgi:hypothetical protein
MSYITAATSVIAARQASSLGKYNQAASNRNAEVLEQKKIAQENQLEFDIARFDQQFTELTGQTKVALAMSGTEFSGSGMRILRRNAEEAEIQKDIMEYNSKVAQAQTMEQANFARISGNIAKRRGDIQAIGYYGTAASALGETEKGKSLLKTFV